MMEVAESFLSKLVSLSDRQTCFVFICIDLFINTFTTSTAAVTTATNPQLLQHGTDTMCRSGHLRIDLNGAGCNIPLILSQFQLSVIHVTCYKSSNGWFQHSCYTTPQGPPGPLYYDSYILVAHDDSWALCFWHYATHCNIML